MKIGIFGGCFNPPHKMHIEIATNLIKQGMLDKVVFVPTGNNYTKAELVDIEHRVAMLNLLIDKENMEVSNISRDLNYSYTFQVLDYFKLQYPNAQIFFICGTDNLKEFKAWKNYEYILSNYKLLVVARNGDNVDNLIQEYAKYVDNIYVASIEENLVSSTLIRKALKQGNNEYVQKQLDSKVIEYIENKGLYKS